MLTRTRTAHRSTGRSPLRRSAPTRYRDLSSSTRLSSTTARLQYKKAYADCPPGKRIVGAAAVVVGGGGRVVLEDVTPNEQLTEVSVTAWEAQGGTDLLWGVTAKAICAEPPPGLERVESYPQADHSWTMRFTTAKCPPGKVILGVGGDISHGSGQGGDVTGGVGQVLIRQLLVLRIAGTDSTFFTAYEDEDGTWRAWRPGAYAICATA